MTGKRRAGADRGARRALAAPVLLLAALAVSPPSARAQMVTGEKIPNFGKTFGVSVGERSYPYSVLLIQSSVPGNVLYPGDKPVFTFQIVNDTGRPLAGRAKVDVIAYGTRGIPGDIWVPDMFKIGDAGSVPFDVNIAAHGFQDVTVTPNIPARFGAYALVVDLGPSESGASLGAGARRFLTTMVRTFPASPERLQYPSFCLDQLPIPVLRRLGVQAIRLGVEYVPTTDPHYAEWRANLRAKLNELRDNNITALAMIMGGTASQPLGRPRPHLSDDGTMLDTKSDMAWLPENDPDFSRWVADIAGEHGWPKGPINCFSLWNEPWEGISISGWGADNLRYREMFTAMAEGVEAARRTAKVDVLLGGCDSSTNTLDKLFADGSDTFLKWLDVCTIHYQGLESPANFYTWATRQGPRGRVRIWDTESWVANVDDRIAAVVAGDRAAGYDRAMGVFGGNVCWEQPGRRMLPGGGSEKITAVHVWSPAAAIGASQHFLSERRFKEMVFGDGLPWVMRFDGQKSADDGTLVVVGDLGEEFGHDGLLFRNVRGLADRARLDALKKQLAALPTDAPERAGLEKSLAATQTRTGCALTLPADPAYALYDFYGNLVPAERGRIVVPLDGRGFFLRPSGAKGSFARLVAAVKAARIDGLEPVELKPKDFLAPLASRPPLHVTVTNILNRPVAGRLSATAAGLTFAAGTPVTLAPHETRDVTLALTGAQPALDNRYPLTALFDAGKDGRSEIDDTLRVNLIARRTINVDGNLEEWKGVLPQTVQSAGSGTPTLTEAAWFPFAKYDATVHQGFATAYLALDDKNFYFAARIADRTPDDGMPRFATRDNDADFYPPTAYEVMRDKTLKKRETVWNASPAITPFALALPGGGPAPKNVTVWESTAKSFAIDLKLPEGAPKQVAFYLLDNDDLARRTTQIEVRDTASGNVLARQAFSRFGRGTYAVFALSGSVRVVFSTDNWLSAAVAGVFFDPAPAAARTAALATGAGPTARFLRADEATEGKWQGAYGADGYQIFGAAPRYPRYVNLSVPEIEVKQPLNWPAGVRRYSYRRRPVLPSGNAPNHDNVQIAFNVIPPADAARKGAFARLPGTPEHFTGYRDTDYEYALNPVAPADGGGTEIWRLLAPGMPRKQFYPRQAASPQEGAVTDGKLVIRQDGNTRIVECAIPWTEMPLVKARLDAGQTVKFTFRVNDNAGGAGLELARGRAVSRRNSQTFHSDWVEHWANEVEFAREP